MKTVSKCFQSVPLTGENASKSRILRDIETANVLYFATHGIASADSPLDKSFIALCGSTVSESRLTAEEIQHLSINARLVVLSACQTGLGRAEDAGIIGLARAFKIAGADDVVVSLWNVDDDATAQLMAAFIKHYLENSCHAAKALREAMLDIRKKYKDPRLWASFTILSGKGTVVEH